ncbi:alpha-amylase family glycosyl hydrolase [Gangjinia marincola]|uniref:Alpha-amylase family glycosyl hydrolase n=1 Tax=Gangjinia marincola TaxID=578463 RepID=A0ABN1MGU6_9FLAO
MKKIMLLLLAVISMVSCKDDKKETEAIAENSASIEESLKPPTHEVVQDGVIYELNVRQYSPEGKFSAFTKDIPQLKELGVEIIWVMPIFPISKVKRKATNDKFAEEIEDEEERKKYLGSYYAVSDFTKVNPEFGSIEDFRELVKTAHDNNMYVILDWVPNHTGWDHKWITTNPEYYTKNDKGEVSEPLNEDGTPVGWADVADLNYGNKEMRKQMLADMSYWVEQEDIDGFRCDVAGMVPTDFWVETIPKLREKKHLFMLAEAWKPELMKERELFDMAYGWDTHHVMNDIAQGKKNVSAWDIRMKVVDSMYEDNDIIMNFTSNHDENSWNGTVEERMGEAAQTFAALTFVAPGMPLIYSGQEYDMDHRLKFFEKDSIPKTKGEFYPLYEQLGALKDNPALHTGEAPGSYTRIKTSADSQVLAFEREKDGNKVVFIANLSDQPVSASLEYSGDMVNYASKEDVNMSNSTKHNFEPWQYLILVNK